MEELTKLVCDLQIPQARRDGGGQPHDRRPLFDQRCVWCNVVGDVQKDCADFTEAFKSNVVYLWSGWVYANETRTAIRLIFGRGGMKWLMEEAVAQHTEVVHYSALANIQVGGEGGQTMKDFGF